MATVPKTKRDAAAALRRTIRGIEEAGSPEQPRLPLGVPKIDRTLPGGGLRLGCIHEVSGDEAATGLCAALLARTLATGRHGRTQVGSSDARGTRRVRGGALLWLARDNDLYAPGLVRFGIGAGQLLVVSGLRRRDDMLWAMEEALRCRAVTGVVAETGRIGLAAGRRLMLAAEGTGVLGLVLSRRAGERGQGARGRGAEAGRDGAGVPAAVSRWRVTSVRGFCPRAASVQGDGGRTEPRWRVELLHCRSGRPAEWIVGWERFYGPSAPSGITLTPSGRTYPKPRSTMTARAAGSPHRPVSIRPANFRSERAASSIRLRPSFISKAAHRPGPASTTASTSKPVPSR